VQRIADFLSVAWPVVTEACVHPFDSVTWLAAVQVVTSRCGGDPARLAGLGPEEFTGLARSAVGGWGGQRPVAAICRRVLAAAGDAGGAVAWSRRALFRRVGVCQILCARGLLPVRFRMFIRCLFFALSDAVVPGLRPALTESDLPSCSVADAACPGYRAVLLIPGAAA